VSAETLRRSASLMRERAEAATEGPWTTHESHGRDYTDEGWSYFSVNADKSAHVTVAELNSEEPFRDDPRPDLEHIASWHPAVALAVADWLEAEFNHQFGPTAEAIDVARAYLGESA